MNKYGKVWLSWALGYQPAIQRTNALQVGRTTFSVPGTNAALRGVQWYFNDQLIPAQTNLNLALTLVQPSSEGAYSVLMSNITGVVTRDKVYLRVFPITFLPPQPSNGVVRLQFGTTYGLPVTVQGSSNLINWTTIYTNNAPGGTNALFDPQPLANGSRFFRLLVQ